MHSLYQFITGPLVWISLAVFVVGCCYRLIHLVRMVYEKERFILSFMSLKYSLRSIFHWMIPFGSENMKRHPVMTIVTFAFHICLIITPVFLMSHIVLWEDAWNISWPALPDGLADVMTVIVILACVFFLFRRISRPEVRYVTSATDYVILALAAMPFVTGFYAYHQWQGYQYAVILHILSGEAMLVAIPFTRLIHMVFSVLTRAYMGSEFGGVRHARDW